MSKRQGKGKGKAFGDIMEQKLNEPGLEGAVNKGVKVLALFTET